MTKVFRFNLIVIAVVLLSGFSVMLLPIKAAPEIAPSTEVIYHFPWKCGEKALVTQGYHNCYNEKKERIGIKYAIDFSLYGSDNKKIVTAAADGVVVRAIDEYDTGCYPKQCTAEGNLVKIKHSDGKTSHYYHLAKGSIPEKFRAASKENPVTVSSGEKIGEQGMTGSAGGPHLHFALYDPTDEKQKCSGTVEFTIKNGNVDVHSSELIYGTTWTSHNRLDFDYQLINQTLPPLIMSPSENAYVSFDVKNTGAMTWYYDSEVLTDPEDAIVRLGTNDDPGTNLDEGQDHCSIFFDPSITPSAWITDSTNPDCSRRVAFGTLYGDGIASPNEDANFGFYIHAPDEPGVYNEYFQVVAENVRWLEGPGFSFQVGVCSDSDLSPGQWFCDVPPSHLVYTATQTIAQNTPPGEVPLAAGCYNEEGFHFYCPDQNITRDQVVVMLARWLYQDEITDENALPSASVVREVFKDMSNELPESQRYTWELGARAIQMTFLDGIVHGDGFNFLPQDDINRSQLMIMVMNALTHDRSQFENLDEETLHQFADVTADTTGSQDIWRAYELGIIKGFSDGLFHPDWTATRGEVASILYRALYRNCDPAATAYDPACEADYAALSPNAYQELVELRSHARITDEPVDENNEPQQICFTASKTADDKLREKGLPYVGIFDAADDGMEICYCKGDSIYSTDRCKDKTHLLQPDTDYTYTFTQTRGAKTLTTTLSIPAGAISEETELRYMEVVNLKLPHSGFEIGTTEQAPQYAGRAFKLEAYRDGFIENFQFDQPIYITLNYEGMPDLDKELQLLYWDHSKATWREATESTYGGGQDTFDAVHKPVTISVSHLSEFALFWADPDLFVGNTLIPQGTTQIAPGNAYRAVFEHLYDHNRTHWAAAPFGDGTLGLFDPGTFIAPDAELVGDYTSFTVDATPPISRAYALQPGGVGVLRTTVRAEGGEAASWELAHIRDVLDVYLFGALPYDVLEESDLTAEALADYDLLIVPSVHLGMVDEVVAALDAAGALDALAGFVRDGGTLYTQGNGAIVAQAAGLVPDGTVDLDDPIRLTGPDTNRGQLAVVAPDSPLVYSLITDTLYILTDPTLHPAEGHQVIATLSNAETADTPALVQAEVDAGQVIMQVGHPTDQSRRQQIPLFMDAVLTALSSKAELTGQAVQTFNSAFPSDVFPAYEAGIPVDATLQFANLWDVPLSDVVVTATVANGFNVLQDSIMPPPTAVYHLTAPLTQTQIVWALGTVDPGEITMSYVAETEEDVLAPGEVTFDESVATYQEPAGEVVSMQHWDTLRALMAARLVGDRDLEPDRAYRVPAKGVYLDVALPLENKENTLASNLVLTDVVYLLYPIVDLEDQHTILSTNDGETIWMRNEPFFWGDARYPLPRGVETPTATLTLEDWNGEWCTFTSTYGIHVDPPFSGSLQLRDYGSFITIPPTYTDYISVTAENELLLPCLTMAWDLGDFPGYWYEEPAVRYGVHSRELFDRMVTFVGDPDPEGAVVDATGGSVYVNAGGDPVLYREFIAEAVPYAAQPPTQPRLTWTDVWLRTGEMPLRASFYDVFDWASCTTCDSYTERHAAVNLTFGMMADLDGDGVPETPVRDLPTRLLETELVLMLKSYNLGHGISYDQNLIDLPIFNGLGIKNLPGQENWWDSWSSPLGHSQLVSVTHTPGYDHLYFQQDVPEGVAEVVYVTDTLQTYEDLNREGMFKLHDGARFHYRQVHAGINRYETYDSHVHGVVGLSSDAEVDKVVGPARVSVYGDDIYYLFTMDDPYDPRTFDEDPYLQSWGYGDLVATTYVGGREDKTLFHSILSVDDRTWLRVQIDNNHGEALTGVVVAPQPPAGINVTPLFAEPSVDTVPDPIWPELAFLSLEEIPDAWRGVYYFELQVTEAYTGPLGGVLRIPIAFSADNPPDGFEIPPATIGLRGAGGAAPEHVYGPATQLTLTDTLPSYVNLERAVQLDQAQVNALWNAIDAGQAMTVFAGMSETVSFNDTGNVVSFTLPVTTLPATGPVYIAASAHITPAQHGPNLVNQGAVLGYQDPFAKQWTTQSPAATVEALGAAVWINYYCEGGVEGSVGDRVYDDGGGTCWVPADEPSQILVRLTPYNDGDDVAESIVANVQLPEGVQPISAEPAWLEWLTDTNRLLWELGDLAPGGYKELEIIMQVEPAPKERGESHEVIQHSDGRFTDAFSGELVEGRFGQDFAVWVQGRYYALYLPTLFKQYSVSPDLVVESAAVTAADPDTGQDATVTVVIKNQGDAPVRSSDEFWVDLYVDPDAAPTAANQTWQHLSDEGIAWGITAAALPLNPGESITLTFDDDYYSAEQSVFSGLLDASTPLYVQVDSAHADTDYGAVLEGHEVNGGSYNNIYGPVFPSVP